MEHLSLFNSILDEQIARVRERQTIQFEISVLQDLKRMAENGCFTVYTASPNDMEIKMINNGAKVTIDAVVPRMMWTGERTIADLKKDNAKKNNLLELARAELIAMYSRLGIKNSNVLTSIEEELS